MEEKETLTSRKEKKKGEKNEEDNHVAKGTKTS